jgi:hypothetical protein
MFPMEYFISAKDFIYGAGKEILSALCLIFLELFGLWKIIAPEGWKEPKEISYLLWILIIFVIIWGCIKSYHKLRLENIELKEAIDNNLNPINYQRVDQENEWPVYEIAYLWNEYDPPPIKQFMYKNNHDGIEDLEVEKTFEKLWQAIKEEQLSVHNEGSRSGVGYKTISRDELERYCEEQGLRPKFLFKDER